VESLIDQLVHFIETHQAWAGPLIGLISFGESMVLVGILLPGTAVLVLAGGLVGAGVLSPVPVIIGAVIGAALGDTVSYYLGGWLGRGIVHRWPLNRYKRAVAHSRLFFQRYGFFAILIGRFFGPVRATVPLVAGMLRMKPRPFQIANVLSAIVWAPVILSPGWLVAKNASELIDLSGTDWIVIAVVAAVVIAVAVVGVILYRRAARRRFAASIAPRAAAAE
jgi:membrane protein DedA with SNARE-associated domain